MYPDVADVSDRHTRYPVAPGTALHDTRSCVDEIRVIELIVGLVGIPVVPAAGALIGYVCFKFPWD